MLIIAKQPPFVCSYCQRFDGWRPLLTSCSKAIVVVFISHKPGTSLPLCHEIFSNAEQQMVQAVGEIDMLKLSNKKGKRLTFT